MKTILITIALSVAAVTALASLAFAKEAKPTKSTKAEQGQVIPRDELPEAIKAQSGKKDPKFPGIPSCAKGRIISDMGTVMDLSGEQESWKSHKCYDAKTIYVCAAFGKLSVRCE